ncbi:MAG: amidohydrolase family protein [Caldimonas sp.]
MNASGNARAEAPVLLDEHAHWLPESLLSLLARREQPPFARAEAGGWSFTPALRPRPVAPLAWDLAVRAKLLSALRIRRQTLCLSPLWNIDSQPVEVALPLLQAFNDATAEATGPSTLYRGLAAVPTGDVGAACDELTRAVGLGLEGVVLPACVLSTRTSADRWAPLFALANERQLRVFVHPGHDPLPAAEDAASVDNPWNRRYGLGPQHQVGIAMLTLCDTGWLAAYANVTVQFANLGGSYPFALERLDAMSERTAEECEKRRLAMRRVVVDSASLGPEAIRCARGLLGESAVVFGTDIPLFDARRAAGNWDALSTWPPK